MKRAALVLGMAAIGLAGCEKQIKAPFDRGVCYAVTVKEDGEPEFHVVARDQEQLEFCAARLEEMRIRFLRLGGARKQVVGAYQGRFLFVDSGGVSTAKTLHGGRFVALRRSRDGRLAIPGAFPMDPKDMRNAPAQSAPAGSAAPASPTAAPAPEPAPKS